MNHLFWSQGVHADAIFCHSIQEASGAVGQMIGSRSKNEGGWIFGYGSLMWNHDLRTREIRIARLLGFHQRFCLRSSAYRSTPEKPRVVLGLDHGRICPGLFFTVGS